MKRKYESAPAVEFKSDPASGQVIASVGSKNMNLIDFIKASANHTDVASIIKALQQRMETEGYDPQKDFVKFVDFYLGADSGETKDVVVTGSKAIFDEDEIKDAKEFKKISAGYLEASKNFKKRIL